MKILFQRQAFLPFSKTASSPSIHPAPRYEVIIHLLLSVYSFRFQNPIMEAQPPNKTAQLAATIASNTTKFDGWLTSHGLPSPSFDIETPPKLELPEDISQSRQAIVEATTELQALMLGSVGHLQNETRDVSRPTTNILSCADIFLFSSIPTLLLYKPYIDLKSPIASQSTEKPLLSSFRRFAAWTSRASLHALSYDQTCLQRISKGRRCTYSDVKSARPDTDAAGVCWNGLRRDVAGSTSSNPLLKPKVAQAKTS